MNADRIDLGGKLPARDRFDRIRSHHAHDARGCQVRIVNEGTGKLAGNELTVFRVGAIGKELAYDSEPCFPSNMLLLSQGNDQAN